MSRDGAPFWISPLARLAAGLVLGLGATWRMEYADGFHTLDAELRAGRKCIYAFWHSRLLPLVVSHRGRGGAVLISRHRDGEWIARLIEALGFRTARGSSTRGGEAGLREMLDMAERGIPLAMTPDGPRGPARVVKPGLVYLARRTGWPVVPVASATNRCWTFESWDRFQVPRPFARVCLAYGTPLQVPPALDEDGEETWRLRLQGSIQAVTAAADAAVGARA